MLVESAQKNGYHVLRVKDSITLNTDLSDLRRVVDEYLQAGVQNFALGFSADSYFYTKHISVLVQCLERIRERGGKLAVINPNEDIVDVLKTIGFFDLTRIFDTEDELGMDL